MRHKKYFPDVIIIYERKAREYLGCCLLKAELEKRGYSAWICHHSYRHMWLCRIIAKPKVVISLCALTTELMPGWTVMDQHSCFLRGSADYYINLQAEQLFRNGEDTYNIVFDAAYKEKIYYVCWGEWRARQLRSHGIDEEHIVITGALQRDLCQPRFSGLYANKQELAKRHQIDLEKEWILFISSFPYVTYTKEELHWGAKVMNACREQVTVDTVYELREAAILTYQTILSWIDQYLGENNHQVMIYRPHPGEKMTPMIENLLKKYPDTFKVIFEDGIQQWICVCDYVDTWVSTAMAETVFLKKHCNIIQPFPAPPGFQPVFMDKFPKILSYEQFADAHRKKNLSDRMPEGDILSQYYSNKMAYVSICDLVENLYQKKSPRFYGSKAKIIKYIFSRQYLLSLYAVFVLTFHIKLSKIIPFEKLKLTLFESRLSKHGDIYIECTITPSDKHQMRKIKKIVNR